LPLRHAAADVCEMLHSTLAVCSLSVLWTEKIKYIAAAHLIRMITKMNVEVTGDYKFMETIRLFP